MEKTSIFDFSSYRDYLNGRFDGAAKRLGLRRKASEALGIHPTFLSQVLLGKANLSLEQAEKLNDFFSLNEEEGEFFLLLVLKERAGHHQLRKRFEKKIENILTQRSNIKKRLETTEDLQKRFESRYYSSHFYAAIHVLCSIPKYQNVKALAEVLSLPEPKVSKMIQFLVEMGALLRAGETLLVGPRHLHLSNYSENIQKHHTNWRVQAIRSLDHQESNDLHYSAIFSLSHADAESLKNLLISHLKEITNVVEKSKEEKAYVYNFDFFRYG